MRDALKAMLLAAAVSGGVSTAQASQIMVGQCVYYEECWYYGGVDWSASLSLADLTALGLGASVPLIAAQTSEYIIRLGMTTITFETPGGAVTETLPEFSGSRHEGRCDLCEIDIVGYFDIPIDATSALISGAFGNSLNLTSAGANVCLGGGGPFCLVEPGTVGLVGVGMAAVALSRRRERTTRAA